MKSDEICVLQVCKYCESFPESNEANTLMSETTLNPKLKVFEQNVSLI